MNLSAAAMVILLLCLLAVPASAGSAGQDATFIPPLAPTPDETPISAVPAWPLHAQLEACFASEARLLADEAHQGWHTRIGRPLVTLNPRWGYLLRADFTRDGVSFPLVNRILCWDKGQLSASRLDLPPLESQQRLWHPLAVPGARHR